MLLPLLLRWPASDLVCGDTRGDGGPLQLFMMLMENRNISFLIDQKRLGGRAADVTPLKIFVMCSQLFVTQWQKLNDHQQVRTGFI